MNFIFAQDVNMLGSLPFPGTPYGLQSFIIAMLSDRWLFFWSPSDIPSAPFYILWLQKKAIAVRGLEFWTVPAQLFTDINKISVMYWKNELNLTTRRGCFVINVYFVLSYKNFFLQIFAKFNFVLQDLKLTYHHGQRDFSLFWIAPKACR